MISISCKKIERIKLHRHRLLIVFDDDDDDENERYLFIVAWMDGYIS